MLNQQRIQKVGIILTAALILSVAGSVTAQSLRKVAIVVENRAGKALNDKVPVLEDLLTSRIAGKGYSVISRDVVTRALKDYSNGVEPNGQATELDKLLENNTSALRLAQNLGADYILASSILTSGVEKKTFNAGGVSTVNITQKLRVGYKIIEAGAGGAVRGNTVTVSKTVRQTADLQVEDSDVNELLDEASVQLADKIAEQGNNLPVEIAKDAVAKFQVACVMADPRQQPITVSVLGVSADNRVIATNQPVAVQAMDVTVELDGAAIGSAPGAFQARPGFHKMRLTREGFEPWERTVNVTEGQNLRVALQMSAAGYARWKDTADFLATLDANRKLTDAEAKRIEGIAKFFSESHYRVDTKENVHVTYKSLF
jgi:hypothetical protein